MKRIADNIFGYNPKTDPRDPLFRKTLSWSVKKDGYDENNDKVDGVNVYYDQIDEVVYLVKIILEEMEGKDHGESS